MERITQAPRTFIQRLDRKFIAGLGLIELVLFIVIVGIATSGILIGMVSASAMSVDPLKIQQGVNIAESYLEEILSKPFLDPYEVSIAEDPSTVPTCPTPPSSRQFYDNVCDYKGLPESGEVTDQLGNPIEFLDDFTVTVAIKTDEDWSVDPPNTIPASDVMIVTVTVYHPSFGSLQLIGHRTRYGYS